MQKYVSVVRDNKKTGLTDVFELYSDTLFSLISHANIFHDFVLALVSSHSTAALKTVEKIT